MIAYLQERDMYYPPCCTLRDDLDMPDARRDYHQHRARWGGDWDSRNV
jgi:hypothetical protein